MKKKHKLKTLSKVAAEAEPAEVVQKRRERAGWMTSLIRMVDEKETTTFRPEIASVIEGLVHAYLYSPLDTPAALDAFKNVVKSLAPGIKAELEFFSQFGIKPGPWSLVLLAAHTAAKRGSKKLINYDDQDRVIDLIVQCLREGNTDIFAPLIAGVSAILDHDGATNKQAAAAATAHHKNVLRPDDNKIALATLPGYSLEHKSAMKKMERYRDEHGLDLPSQKRGRPKK